MRKMLIVADSEANTYGVAEALLSVWGRRHPGTTPDGFLFVACHQDDKATDWLSRNGLGVERVVVLSSNARTRSAGSAVFEPVFKISYQGQQAEFHCCDCPACVELPYSELHLHLGKALDKLGL